MIKAMRDVRPANVRQFFALANQHMRWELNDLARRLDAATCTVQLYDSRVPAAAAAEPRSAATDPQAAPSGGLARVLAAIEALPEEEPRGLQPRAPSRE